MAPDWRKLLLAILPPPPDPNLASNKPTDPNTLAQNLRLSLSWQTILAVFVHPPAAGSFWWYMVTHQSDDGLLSRKWQILLPLFYCIFAITVPCVFASEHQVKKLAERGYEQRRDTIGQLEWWLAIGLCWGWSPWMKHVDFASSGYSDGVLISATVGMVLAGWMGVVVMHLGPIWLFTETVRK